MSLQKLTCTVVAVTFLLLVVSGCSHNVAVVEGDFSPNKQNEVYRIQTSDDQYDVRRFTVTDSTIVIQEFAESDGKRGTVPIPVVVDRSKLLSVTLRSANDRSGLIVFGVLMLGIAVGVCIAILQSFPDTL